MSEYDQLVEEGKKLAESLTSTGEIDAVVTTAVTHAPVEVEEESTYFEQNVGLALNKTRLLVYIVGVVSGLLTLIFTLAHVYGAIPRDLADTILISLLTFVSTLSGLFGITNFVKK
ncbi:MAG: hypothetical protein LBL41_05785 [Bifidobacteriaceae bacterium]|jgi:hypothetical protein|nr:hypothetical protein [Bifidobacteriaceae bacterium]